MMDLWDGGLVLGLLAARHVALTNCLITSSNAYPIVFATGWAVAYKYSRSRKVATFVALLLVFGRVLYRYVVPREVLNNGPGPANTTSFALGFLAVIALSSALRRKGRSKWVNRGLYLQLYYLLATTSEWVLHKYIMHCDVNAHWLLNSKSWLLHDLRRTCNSHRRHHLSVASDMSLVGPHAGDAHALVFDWVLTAKLLVLLPSIMYVVVKQAKLGISLKTHAIASLVAVLGFSVVWNTVHPDMHRYDGGFPAMPPRYTDSGDSVTSNSLLYRNHQLHHQVKGKSKGNFNVVFLAGDELFGTNRLT